MGGDAGENPDPEPVEADGDQADGKSQEERVIQQMIGSVLAGRADP
ncbi:hypothetical protein BBL17_024200 [Agrobacterium vitis]|uniref:Uncharacterized protein n=1 Tax=Agrobacterium vitis TaxID=373 RepID=A0ABW9TLI1_AGRVI|nr:hypothetical protein [Agrobacterium vitis]